MSNNVAPDEAENPVQWSPHRQGGAMGEGVFDPSFGLLNQAVA
jgi:hypothetical protein